MALARSWRDGASEVSDFGYALGSTRMGSIVGRGIEGFRSSARGLPIEGTTGDDVLIGTADDEKITAKAGDDVVFGRGGNDYISGDGGDDVISGGRGTDEIRGEDGDDVVLGDAGDDYIYGYEGVDTLIGGNGNDQLEGGDGDDTMTGGRGRDVFIIGGADNTDTITDFSVKVDKISIRDYDFHEAWGPSGSKLNFTIGTESQGWNNYFFYNPNNGLLYFDADGNETAYGANPVAQLLPQLALTADNFIFP